MLTTLAAEFGLARVVDVAPVLPQDYHWREMFRALLTLRVLSLLNGDPPGTVADAILISHLHSLAFHSAKSTQPHTKVWSINHFIKHSDDNRFQGIISQFLNGEGSKLGLCHLKFLPKLRQGGSTYKTYIKPFVEREGRNTIHRVWPK